MANKTTKKAKRQGGKHAAEGHNADGTTDERFSAAETRPQFSSGRRRRNHKEEEDGGGNVNNDDNSDDELEKRPHRRDDDDDYDDGEGGFGHSLAEAIKSDDRFKEALSNQEKFGCVPLLDKYGRKTKQAKKMKRRAKNEKQSKTGSENEDEDEDENEIENENDQSTKSKNNKAKVKSKKAKGQSDSESEDEAVNGNENMGQQKEEDEEEDPLESNDMESRIAYLNALSRGEIDVSSSHDDDSSSDEDDNNDDDDDDDSDRDDASSSSTSSVHGKAGVLDPSYNRLPGDFADQNEVDYDGRIIELTDEATPYLAILNLDWTNVRAVDVFAMLHSFCPPGTLKKVEVYPSDFGRKMMEKERVEGPSGLWKDYKQKMKNRNNNEAEGKESLDDDDDEDGRDDSDSDSDNCSESTDEDDEPVDAEDSLMPGEYDSDNDDDEHSNEEDMSDEEDILNIDEATAKLYSHFPHQSQLKSNNKHKSRNTTNLPEDEDDEGFDHEKLRAYEASKLRYYFAIATFTSPQAANDVYNHVDGMEMEHSAAEIDVRALPAEQYDETIEGRTLRDECTSLPAKYAPPDSVVTALRQSKVTCSWETGDAERENKLTRYGMGKEAWEALAGGDDIKFYLASDHSSADEDESEDGDESEDDSRGGGNKGNKEAKAKNVRALLGLGGSDDDDDDGMENGGLLAGRHESVSADSSRDNNESDVEQTEGVPTTKQSIKKLDQKSRHDSSDSEASEDDEEGETAKQVTYTPGKRNLEERIRSKLQSKQAVENGEQPDGGLTPFQKYLEKRKEKRRERRQAIRNKKKNQEENGGDASGEDGDGMYEVDPEFGVAQFSDEEEGDDDVMRDGGDNDDGFFLGESKKSKAGKSKKHKESLDEAAEEREKGPSTKEELELLIDGDDDEENEKDYDMRGLAKLEKNANKKLKGKRKRQMETLAANVSGQEFKIDTTDDRFAALLDGSDDRFGIDRTNPLYKETGAMKTLLEEQAKRRKKNQAKKTSSLENVEGVTELNKRAAANDGGGWVESSGGAMELSSLVKSLQNKISKKAAEEKPMKEKTKQHGQ